MKKNLLFCGLGSIGQRHLRIIQKLYPNRFKIYYYKETKKEFLIDDKLKINKKVKSLSKYYKIKRIKYSELNKKYFDFVFITNQPSKHIKFAMKFANLKSNIFIEKPLSTDLNKLNDLLKIQKKNKINIFVGYNFRMHPLVKKVSQLINKKKLGIIINSTSYFGEYIPLAHEYENYKKSHYTNKVNGGATLGFCHNIDLCLLFHKKIKKILFKILENKNLNIKGEEVSSVVMRGKNNELIHLHNNFYNYPKDYFFLINFSRGTIKLDLSSNILTISDHSKKIFKNYVIKNFQRNKMFEDEIKEFISKTSAKNYNSLSLLSAIDTQRLISKIR